jgi:DNA primase
MPAELIAAGLATRSRTGHLVDLFRDRIMFPVHHPDGHPVAFLGRAAPSANADAPKYLNTPDTAIYHKGQILYGAGEQADRVAAGATPILVEGPVDVLAVALAFPAGDRVGIATCGTGLTTHHAAAIAAMPGAAGRKATERAWQLLTGHRAIGLFAATLPDHTDPGDLITSTSDIADLRAALTTHARPLAKAVIDNRLDELATRRPDLLRWIEGRVIAARASSASSSTCRPTRSSPSLATSQAALKPLSTPSPKPLSPTSNDRRPGITSAPTEHRSPRIRLRCGPPPSRRPTHPAPSQRSTCTPSRAATRLAVPDDPDRVPYRSWRHPMNAPARTDSDCSM